MSGIASRDPRSTFSSRSILLGVYLVSLQSFLVTFLRQTLVPIRCLNLVAVMIIMLLLSEDHIRLNVLLMFLRGIQHCLCRGFMLWLCLVVGYCVLTHRVSSSLELGLRCGKRHCMRIGSNCGCSVGGLILPMSSSFVPMDVSLR